MVNSPPSNGHAPHFGNGSFAQPGFHAPGSPHRADSSNQNNAWGMLLLGLRAFRRWWKVILPVSLVLGALAGFYVWFTFTPKYRASAWLRISEKDPFVVDQSGGQSSRMFVATQAQLIRSPLVLEQVLAKSDIARFERIQEHVAPLAYLMNGLKVKASAASEIFIISFDGEKPENAAKIVNATVEAYFKMHDQDESARMQRVIELLEEERARRRVAIEQRRERVRDMRIKQFGDDEDPHLLSDEETLKIDFGKLTSDITRREIQKELMQANYQAFKERVENQEVDVEEAFLEGRVEKNEKIARLRQESKQLRAMMTRILETSRKGEQDPTYIDLEQQFEQTNRALNDQVDRVREQAREEKIDEVRKNQQDDLLGMERRMAEIDMEINLLRDRFFQQKEDVREASGNTMNLKFEVADLHREEAIYQAISTRIMRLRTEMRAPARVELLKPATEPKLPSEQLSIRKIAIFSLVAAMVPFFLAFLWEQVVKRVDGPQQLWQADLTVVGEIAKLPVSSRLSGFGSSEQIGRDVSLFEESIDSLRTSLVLSDYSAASRVMVVTSAVSGEGKTSVASQLAVSLARSTGEPTLLIDADMRSPDIHNVFDVPNEPGLAQVLGREATLDEAVVTSWSNYVHLLPAGLLKASPHKLLGDGALRTLMADLRSRYRHVIIDTSPILSASESLVLAKSADATLLCAMRDVSRVDQVQKAYERLVNTGARPLGTVLNGVPTNRYAYLYGVYAYPRD